LISHRRRRSHRDGVLSVVNRSPSRRPTEPAMTSAHSNAHRVLTLKL